MRITIEAILTERRTKMANVKRLQPYLTGVCELMSDAGTYGGKEKLLEEYRKTDPDLKMSDFITEFVKHEVNENGTVTYYHSCKVCGIEHETVMSTGQDFLYLGSCPSDEEPRYPSEKCCATLKRQIIRKFGKEPAGATLSLKYEAGEDGYTLVCYFDPQYPLSLAYALMLESEFPEHWTEVSKIELGIRKP